MNANPDMSDCVGPMYVVGQDEWMRALRLGTAICGCGGCGGDVKPLGPPERGHNGVKWFQGECAQCHEAYAWPDGRTQAWWEEFRRRQKSGGGAGERRGRSKGPVLAGYEPPGEDEGSGEPEPLQTALAVYGED